jgi:hypothetical protein
MRFAFIHSERDAYPITALCRVMQVARSGYHVTGSLSSVHPL